MLLLDSQRGIAEVTDNTTILNSYNTGDIKAHMQSAGIVATPYFDEIYNSYNVGEIYTERDMLWTGGISGQPATITNCYNLGKVTNGGEITGLQGVSEIKNVYYISGRNLVGDDYIQGTVTNAVEMTESEMRSQKLVDALNANIGDNTEWARWKLGPKGYPVLDI